VNQELGPTEFAKAIKETLRKGGDLYGIPSDWIHIFFPTDCGGLVPVASDAEAAADRETLYSLLQLIGLEGNAIETACNWYFSQPHQGEQCCVGHPGEFVCGLPQQGTS
jgi:hypothetical protein